MDLYQYIANKAPKFSKVMVEGLVYHRLRHAVNYIDNYIRYTINSKTNTYLKYLGYRALSPQEEINFAIKKNYKVVYDIAENDIYLVEFMFQYADNPEIFRYPIYIPYARKGNIILLSGKRFLVSPTLADKVISIGERIIFINILTSKHSFERFYYSIGVNNKYHSVPVITTEIYRNQKKKLEDTTKASVTVMHYLLSNYGYSKTMELLLGFTPKAVYDYEGSDKFVIHPTGLVPKGYIRDKSLYKPSRIKFIVDEENISEEVLYCLGNVFYIIDNFPDKISIDDLDNPFIWKKLLGEILFSGNHKLSYIFERIIPHFNDINSPLDPTTIKKLRDIGVEANSLMDLLLVIFKNFNTWILNSEVKSIYHNKTFEVESYVLSQITFKITKAILEISKEELRLNGKPLNANVVFDQFKKNLATRAIFSLKKERDFVTSIEYPGDHLYPKYTAILNIQESDYVNKNKNEANTSERKKITADMVTVGSLFALSKKNPHPLLRLNPYCQVNFETGVILPHSEYEDIIEETNKLLSNFVVSDSVVGNEDVESDKYDDDEESYEDYEHDSDYEVDQFDVD